MSKQEQINSISNAMRRVTAKDFAAKFRDKQEVYHFLTHEVGAYLSSYDTMTVWHMRDLVAGNRRMIKGKDAKHLNVPQYFGLKIDAFVEYAKSYPEVMKALPLEMKEIKKLPRQYIINVLYTLVGTPFREWVDNLVDGRHEKMAEERDMNIDMDPEIRQIFNKSKAVSTS